ncbi:hypothetical protein F383_08760 [Gossypium arboreum]|uniref:Uncharacterized protein n=1 Tax=Gossypium arboreum TaxID=29729 RepID=A0A0B0MVW4_GOSAR|nr:hypothetical protein F383_08760 [Gossypium arboreum]
MVMLHGQVSPGVVLQFKVSLEHGLDTWASLVAVWAYVDISKGTRAIHTGV